MIMGANVENATDRQTFVNITFQYNGITVQPVCNDHL